MKRGEWTDPVGLGVRHDQLGIGNLCQEFATQGAKVGSDESRRARAEQAPER